EALGFDQPRFAHIPLMLGPDRSKLSKRHGAPNVCDFHEKGYPSEAVINYLAFLGWSVPDGREIVSIDELIAEFTLERVSKAPGIFDIAKLDWVSAQHIRAGGSDRYLEDALPYFPPEFKAKYSLDTLREIMDILSENLSCFSMIGDEAAPFRPGPPDLGDEASSLLGGLGDLVAAFTAEFEALGEWNSNEIREAIKRTGKRRGVKGRDLFMPLRAAVTGILHGPDLVNILRIRGREDVLGSLRKVSNKAGT
ncbi:MAG: glutamate--tRNA ligase, partial [Candidatus Krumholzibacteria bacterium]|nr:glutamate--tRNA ligase [Candidatus Krumholzibacteria bacterium]